MNKQSDWIILGCFGRPQGLKGWVRVTSYTEPQDAILDYLPWHMQQQDRWIPLTVMETSIQNQMILVKLANHTQREDIANLTHLKIGVPNSTLPSLAPGEYYWHELENMRVLNLNGHTLGVVEQILATGANDVLVVRGNKRHLIPYIPELYIKSIDVAQREIVVDWDESF